ncbi:peptidase [Legionella qingyii]|uniref:LysM peptidoglycan-binding domain-containing protein n=1 Tax=Legionella qingyii TaxID=2184757 RepID=A0A317U7H5_9GAMM|nr:peptidoglycan DD-metalloendopeptidase family protein [Legionella qingyii]PWY56350.1 peptidase [Legionella qingyii]PWY57294.1 peptidase [Legionella qingyii]RUR24866.1 LysM peptidoglycan-binding domain-containing protein [Legionella qingyii]
MIVTFCKRFLCLFLIMTLVGCGNNLAPVMESRWNPYWRHQKVYVVKRGDTLFSIAFRYDTDYQTLARLNRINPPYSLRVGQVINLRGITPRHRQTARRPVIKRNYYVAPKTQARPTVIYSPANRFARSASGWMWPVSGHVVTSFVPEQGKKGINIACKKGERVIAAASGVVAYAGSGLAGYGNLIIIKHNQGYLTAYGYNARIMVSEGQHVKAGQTIAIAGVIDRKYTGVHFEIRRSGVPVNPLNYLQKG